MSALPLRRLIHETDVHRGTPVFWLLPTFNRVGYSQQEASDSLRDNRWEAYPLREYPQILAIAQGTALTDHQASAGVGAYLELDVKGLRVRTSVTWRSTPSICEPRVLHARMVACVALRSMTLQSSIQWAHRNCVTNSEPAMGWGWNSQRSLLLLKWRPFLCPLRKMTLRGVSDTIPTTSLSHPIVSHSSFIHFGVFPQPGVFISYCWVAWLDISGVSLYVLRM